MSKRVKKVVKLASEANLKGEINLYRDWLQDAHLDICAVDKNDDCQEDMLFWSGDTD